MSIKKRKENTLHPDSQDPEHSEPAHVSPLTSDWDSADWLLGMETG